MLLPKGKKVNRIKPKRFEDKTHLDFIRTLPCVSCLKPAPSQVHHILCNVVRGMGLKAPDDKCIPVCHDCHNSIHHVIGDECTALGFNPYSLAKRLYEVTGDYNKAVYAIGKERSNEET